MIRKKISQRVGVFVDVSNLYHSAKNLYKAKVNFGEVLRAAVGERQLIRAIAYVVRGPGMEQESFFEALRKSEFEVKAKDLQVFAGGAKKGDWDVGLALDAIKIADHLDVVILVTGDGDYVPLVEYLKQDLLSYLFFFQTYYVSNSLGGDIPKISLNALTILSVACTHFPKRILLALL